MFAVYLAMLDSPADQKKFTILYEACERKLFAIAMQYLNNSHNAEDAMQQCWLNLIRNWEKVSALSLEQATGYAVTTIKHVAVDLLWQDQKTISFPEHWDPPAKDLAESDGHYLVELIHALPACYRDVLEGKFILGESMQELSQRLHLKQATVGTRVARGKALLREQLEKEGIYYG